MLNGLTLFDLGRFLLVLGLTLAVIRYANALTEFKSPRAESRKQLKMLGFGCIVVGIAVGALGFFTSIQDELKAIKGIGTDIIAVGFSCVFQYKFNTKKQQSYLEWSSWVLILVGAIVSVLAVFADVYKWY